jgi:GH25 family lysozyme M1 (1,4-beta-N-acetylmuramidase)
MKGLDISSYQNGINFNQIKNAGVQFLILRAGFTGWGTGVNYNKDTCFENFYKQAKQVGIPVGAYWYSCANNYEKGVAEAKFMYENCLKGKQFEFPIYIDVEEDRHQKVGKTYVTSAIKGFCETLENLGYYVGIYANLNYFNNYINTPSLYMYDKWFAYWKKDLNKPSFPYGDYGLWQNSSDGYVAGQRVDTNIAYKDYPTIIKNAKLNGFTDNNVIVNELDKYTDEQLAKMVWQGKFGNGEERKIQLGDRYDRVQNLVNQGVGKLKSIDEIAKEVINGKWKNYPERKTLLENAGYNYSEVQKRVNELLR